MDFGINNINNKLLLSPIPKPDDLPIIKNIDLIKNNKNFIENKKIN